MPDHPDAPVARFAAGAAPRLVTAACLGNDLFRLLQLRRAQGFANGSADSVELVVAGQLLDRLAAAVVVKHDEVPHQGQEALRLAHAFQHHLQLGQAGIRQGFAGGGAPGLEPFLTCSQGADACGQTVGDHQDFVHCEQGGKFGLVGLELLPGSPDGGVRVGGVLQFDDAQGQAVEEQDDIGAAGAPVATHRFRDRELVDGQPVVVGRTAKVQDLRLLAPDAAVSGPVLHVDAVDQHPVELPVARLLGGPFGPGQLAESIVNRRVGQFRVQPGQGIPQPSFQDHLPVVGPLRAQRIRGYVGAMDCLPADGSEPFQGRDLNFSFGEGDHI